MILVCFNFLLKQTFSGWRSMAITTVILALFAAMMWHVAIEQSKTQIADWIENTELMRNISVILSLDAIIQLAFGIMAVQKSEQKETKRSVKIFKKFLKHYPGLLIFPVTFGILIELIFMLPGTSFSLIAYLLAASILIIVPVGSRLLRTLLPESDLRLEILFLSNVLVAMIGVIATVNGETQNKPADNVDFYALSGVVLLLMAGIVAGIGINALKQRKRRIKKQLMK